MDNGRLIQIIVILVLILVIIGLAYYGYIKIRNKVRRFSRMAFGTFDIVDGIKSVEMEEELTPKSVASATNLYLPNIMRDFPDFHYDEMKTRAENVLISYLRSVDAANVGLLTEGTSELKELLSMKIGALRDRGEKEHFQNIHIHRTEIHKYRKEKGRCSIVLQSAVESIHFVEKDGEVLRGKNDRREQSRYNVEAIYIQDRDVIENSSDAGLAMNCPNCGAPLRELGAKKCPYCDSPVMEFNICTWNFAAVEES